MGADPVPDDWTTRRETRGPVRVAEARRPRGSVPAALPGSDVLHNQPDGILRLSDRLLCSGASLRRPRQQIPVAHNHCRALVPRAALRVHRGGRW
jgi:hypothetical protein